MNKEGARSLPKKSLIATKIGNTRYPVVSLLLSKDSTTLADSFANLIKQMLAKTRQLKRHGAVMVVDDNKGKLIGIITDGDFRRLLTKNGAKALNSKVKNVMTADCKRIRAKGLATEAMAIFHKYRIDDLPVVDADDRPVGMIDLQDVMAIKIVG